MTLLLVALLLVVGGCNQSRDLSEYHWKCYTYEPVNETERTVIEYPCKVKHETKTGTGFSTWEEVKP